MLNELLENNYKEILKAAVNITRRRDRHQAKALINETFLKVFEKDNYPTNNTEFIGHYVKTMYFLYKGERSSYNKAETSKHITLEFDPGNEDWKHIELDAENINKETKDTMLAASNLTTDKAIRYVKILEIKDSLPPHEKEIFSLHYEQGLSSRQIALHMEKETGWKMSYVRFNEMINKVKAKLNG